MAFLTISGVTYPVVEGGASEQEPVRIGSVNRAFSGLIRSSVRSEKRVRTFKVIELTQAQYETLRTTVAMGQVVNVGGTIMGTTRPCWVTVTGVEPQLVDAALYTFDVDIRVEEA
jgi:hypothetical protein